MTAQRLLLFLTTGALATGGSLCAAGAAHAQSDTLTYTCTTVLGPAASTVVTDTDLPAVMYVGDSKPVGLTSSVTVPWDGAISLAYGLLGARSAEGTATALGTITGPGDYNVPTTTDLTVPRTALADATPLTVASAGVGDAFAPTVPGVYSITAGNFTSVLSFLKEDGTDTGLGPQTIPCTAPTDVSTLVDTITVKAHTTTALALARTSSAFGERVAASATVNTDAGAAAGSVVFTAGGQSVTVPVSAGQASTTLPVLHAGNQEVTATFKPDSTLYDASSSSKNLTVGRAVTTSAAKVKGVRLHRAPQAKVSVTSAAGVPTGQVTLVLKKGHRTVQHKTVALQNGTAVAHLKRLAKKGRYTLAVTYAGTADLAGSSVVQRFRVR